MADWHSLLGDLKQQPYFIQAMQQVAAERAAGQVIYPPQPLVFNAFRQTPLAQLNVVILGQDPYHGPGQAHGLCFSVPQGIKPPPSLQNIFREQQRDLGLEIPTHGNLTSWARQGVLLLNTVLTVRQGQAHSHANIGWESFTDAVIARISSHCRGVVFLLWGSHARKKGNLIDSQRHHVLTAPHPSPLSAHRGFIGCGHFSRTNELLLAQGKTPVNWQLTPEMAALT